MPYTLPKHRPKASKKFDADWNSGDFYTKSTIEVEHYACDSFKIILLMVEQLMVYEKLQKEDILAVIERDIDRHFIETDV